MEESTFKILENSSCEDSDLLQECERINEIKEDMRALTSGEDDKGNMSIIHIPN